MSEKVPKLVIVTRTKNRPRFLSRAISSVANQTNKDFVHVIVNDDGDKEVVEQTVANSAGSDYKTKVVHVSTNNHMEASTNAGIKAVKSDYIAVHDDDDTWHPEFVERVLARFGETKAEGIVVRTNKITERLSDDGQTIKKLKETPWMPDMKAVNLYRQFIENQMTPITFVFSRKAYVSLGEFDESLQVMGDWDFGIRFIQKHDVDFIDPGFALAFYHHRKFKAHAQGNSFSADDKRVIYSNKLMNKHLRAELAEGRLGVGYIMSKTKYEQNFMIRMISKTLPGRLQERFLNRFKRV